MDLQLADYLIGGLTVILAVTGLFRGFSGTLGFVAGGACAAAVGSLAWTMSPAYTGTLWVRAAATLVAALLAFGIVRWAVKKIVNGLLSQPTDAICGFAIGVMTGLAIVTVWAHLGIHLEYSTFASDVAAFLN